MQTEILNSTHVDFFKQTGVKKMEAERKGFLDAVQDFCKHKLGPLAQKLDEEGRFPSELQKEMGEIGLFGAEYPVEWGGKGLDGLTSYQAIEELGKYSGGIALTVHVQWMATDILIKFGTEEQKKKYLPAMLTGEKIAAFCVSEFRAGSDAAGIAAEAKKTEAGWIASGSKWFCTNGQIADIYFVGFKTDPTADAKGISIFIIDKDTKGFTIGASEGKLGCRSSITTGLSFDQCLLKEESLLGKENEGFKIAMHALTAGRLGMAAMGLGIAEAALDLSAKYANQRSAFGKPLSALYSIQEMLANMYTKIEASKALVYQAATRRSEGKDYSLEGSIAKLMVAETVNEACHQGLQIFGGHGYMKYYDIERIARDGRLLDIGVGASEVLKMIVGSSVAKIKGTE